MLKSITPITDLNLWFDCLHDMNLFLVNPVVQYFSVNKDGKNSVDLWSWSAGFNRSQLIWLYIVIFTKSRILRTKYAHNALI